MFRTILPGLSLLFPLMAHAADEGLLFPDVTPATTTEFGFSKLLEEELLIRLEGVGFLLLNGDVLSQGVQDQMMLCAEDVHCPQGALAAVPARLALVVRVEKIDGKYQVDAALYVREFEDATATKQFSAGLAEIAQVAQEVADFVDEEVDTLGAPEAALRSMASQLIQASEIGERVWVSADVGPCEGVYQSDDMLAHLDQAEDFLRFSDRQGAFRVARQMEEGLLCYEDILVGPTARQLYARVFRAVGAGLFMGGQEQQATPWIVGAVQLDPQFEYGLEDMAEDHPVWKMFRTLKALSEGEAVEYAGTILGPGEHFLDGSSIDAPVAHDGQKHLYQRRLDGQVDTWVIDGNRFPPEAVEFLGLVETERVKRAKDKNRKVASDEDIKTLRGVSMVDIEPKVIDLAWHLQGRVGVGVGAIDRRSHLRNQSEGERWFQEGPQGATRPRFEGYLGLEIQSLFEVGILGGVQLSRHEVDAGVDGATPGALDVSAESTQMKAHGFIQPRVQVNLGKDKIKISPFAGIDVRLLDGSELVTDTVSFSEVPSGVMLGAVSGLGFRFKMSQMFSLMLESSWTGHFGLRAGAVQQGQTPTNKPNPSNVMRHTIGGVGGLDVSF